MKGGPGLSGPPFSQRGLQASAGNRVEHVLPAGARFDAKLHGHRSAQRGALPLVTLFLKV